MRRWVLALGLAACGGGVVQRADELPPPPPDQGFVQIACEPRDVDLYVDGDYSGRLDGYPEGVLRLPRGPHRLEIRQRGHYTFYAVFDVGEQPVTLSTHLVPEPSP